MRPLRGAGDEKTGKQLQEAVIGGIHIELGGLAYLLFGIVLASVPKEVAGLFQIG